MIAIMPSKKSSEPMMSMSQPANAIHPVHLLLSICNPLSDSCSGAPFRGWATISCRNRAFGAGRRWLGAQVREHCEHAPVVFGGGGEPELLEDARHVLLDRAFGDDEAFGDALVRP